MEDHGQQQDGAGAPQRHGVVGVVQKSRVGINLLGIGRINLEVAKQVSHHVAHEDDPGNSHDGLLANGGVVEAYHARSNGFTAIALIRNS